jgi:Domain of unknown function (DUF4919)
MRIMRIGFSLVLCVGITGMAQAADYAALLGRLKANDFTVDFRALRLAYTQTPGYHPNSSASREFRKQVQTALERKDYKGALKAADAWLATEYVNPFAQLGAARAYDALGEAEQARFHNRVADGIYDSLCLPGQGRSAAAPCQVISLDEEHFYLARHQFQVGGQYEETCLVASPCSVYEVRAPNSEVLDDIHFDVSIPFAYQQAHAQAPVGPAEKP